MAKETTKKAAPKDEPSVEDRANDAANAISAKFSGPLAPLEKSLNEIFVKKAPVQLPKGGREALVGLAPWLSIFSGIFGLVSAFGLWRAAHRVNEVVDYANRLSESLGMPSQQVDRLGITFWLSIIMLVLFSILSLLAFPGLKARKKVGWNLVFISSLASIGYAIVSLFYDNGGFSSFVSATLGAVIGLYLLFQVRSYYK